MTHWEPLITGDTLYTREREIISNWGDFTILTPPVTLVIFIALSLEGVSDHMTMS